LALVEFLVDHDALENPLFELLCARISEYEKHAPEFKALNQHLEKTPPGVSVLRTLMDQYGLKAADLANELGSKSNVSNILNGRRALTVNHIKALTQRFKLPADAFIE
ncbi:Putative cytoplasmic protein, partial [Salmonella enterica subsp. enterica serovar Gaminara str. A4-567]